MNKKEINVQIKTEKVKNEWEGVLKWIRSYKCNRSSLIKCKREEIT